MSAKGAGAQAAVAAALSGRRPTSFAVVDPGRSAEDKWV